MESNLITKLYWRTSKVELKRIVKDMDLTLKGGDKSVEKMVAKISFSFNLHDEQETNEEKVIRKYGLMFILDIISWNDLKDSLFNYVFTFTLIGNF